VALTYNVLYRENENTTLEEHNSVEALPGEDELDEIVENCKALNVAADLYDAGGFRRGWVHADGSYRLT
jgi:hypothetical protein